MGATDTTRVQVTSCTTSPSGEARDAEPSHVLEVEEDVLGHQLPGQPALQVVTADDAGKAVEGGEVDSRARVEDVEQLLQVEPRLSRRHHHLGGRGQADAVQEIVQQLRDMPRPAGPHVEDLLAEAPEERLDPLQGLLLASHHDGQRSRLGPLRSARDSRVEEGDALRRQLVMDADARLGRRRAQVDDDLAAPAVGDHGVLAKDDRLDDPAVGQR